MPSISLCRNTVCPLRDNCERALEHNDNFSNQTYKEFYPVKQSVNTSFIWNCYFQVQLQRE